jgi:hypothetical protein
MDDPSPDPLPAEAPAEGAPPTPEAAAPGPKAGSRWKRILLRTVVALVVLLAVLVLLLPVILSSGWARGVAEEKASAASGRRVAIGGLAVGWSDASLRDLEVRWGPGEGDPVLARVGEVRVPAGLSLGFAGRYDLGTVEILRPEIRVDLRELAKPAPAPKGDAKGEAGAAKGGKGKAGGTAGEAAPKPFSVKVSVRDGTLVVVGLDGKETRLGGFSADLAASSDGVCEASFTLDAGAGGKAVLRAKPLRFKGERPSQWSVLDAGLELVVESLDLAPFREPAAVLGGAGLDELRGRLSASITGRVPEDTHSMEGRITVDLTGFVAAGPAVNGGGRIAEPEFHFEGVHSHSRDGAFEIRDAVLRMAGVEAKGNVARSPSGGIVGALTVRTVLAFLGERMKLLRLPFEGGLQGEAVVDVRATSDAAGRRFTGSAVIMEAAVAFGHGRSPVREQEVRAELDATCVGTLWTVAAATVKCRTADLSCSGTMRGDLSEADLKAGGTLDVGAVLRIAKSFGAAIPGEFEGRGALDVRLLRKGGEGDRAEGSLVVTDLSVKPEGAGAREIREPRLEARFDAVPGKDSLEVRSLTIRGAGADVRVAGTAAMDGATGSLTSCEADLDLEKAAALAGSFGAALPVRVTGAASWKGPVSWKGKGAEVAAKGALAARDLVLVLPAAEGAPERTLREREVRASVDATARRAAGGAGYDVVLGPSTVAAEGIDAAISGSLAADGALDLAAKGTLTLAGALGRAAALGVLPKDPAAPGTVVFDVAAKGKPGDLRIDVRALDAKDAEFTLRASGTVAAKGSGDFSLDAGGDVAALVGLAARAGLMEPVAGAAGKATVRGTVKAAGPKDPMQFDFEAGIEGLRWPDAAGGPPWTQKSITATVRAAHHREEKVVKGASVLKSDDGTLQVTGDVAFVQGRRVLDLAADVDLDLGGFCRSRPDLLPLPGMSVGKARGRATLGGVLETPFDLARLKGTAKLVLDSVKTEPVELKDAKLDALLSGGTVTIQALTATVNGGTVSGKGALGFTGEAPKHFLEAKATGIRIDPAMEVLLQNVVPLFAVGSKGSVSGQVRLELRLDATGKDWLTSKRSLVGKGDLAVADGSVSGSGLLGDLLEFVGGGDGIRFDSISTAFEVRERRIRNDRLLVDGKEQSLVFRGSTAFNGDLDYEVGIKAERLGEKTAKRLAPFLDKDGNLVLEVRGDVKKPKVRGPDLKKLFR